jgi:hypothetical protein
LRGVLPSGPGLGALRKPPAYSVKLQVSDGQQRYAAYLDKLVAGETHPRVVGTALLTSNRLWRWLISILLIVAVLLPLVMGRQLTPASTLSPDDLMDTYTLVGALPPGSPVLVVFDYDPAFSGELEAAAAPLMDHLLLQSPRIAFLSTSPTGPTLAERFIQTTPLVAEHAYQSEQQYVNLGYLAGGPAGVVYFAQNPTIAAPDTVSGDPAWALPPLQGVQRLSDFAAVVVLTDNADTGRIWVEQSGSPSSYLGDTPLLMVISAQAEPMLRPYYESGQIKGMVTGLVGGKVYEQNLQITGLAQRYWDSFSVGMLVAEALIVIGALWSVVAGWRARRSISGEEA